MAVDNLMGYGIAVNFLGNYQREGQGINNLVERLNTGLTQLRNLVIGGGIITAFSRFGNSLLTYAKSMEQNFANLKSTLGSTSKALETLDWARRKGASTPFEIDEVNNAVGTMTTLGFNKNDKQREEVFNSVGDFAALRGFDFNDMMQRVAKASFGNWESLGDQFGIRKQTIGGMAREQMNRTPEKFAGQEGDINKAIQMVEKGKQGTEEYRMAIVKLIGVLGSGGMINRLQTISGAMSNVSDITANLMMNIVGYTQQVGSLSNAVKTTIVEGILNPFSDAHTVVVNGISQQITAVDQLGVIGQGVGEIFKGVWSLVDSQIKGASGTLIQYIDKLYIFFQDFKNNLAPIVLFVALIKIEIEEFLKGFWDGISTVFPYFIKAAMGVWKAVGEIVRWLGITDLSAKSLGKTLGWIAGLFLGWKAFMVLIAPLQRINVLLGNMLPVMGKVFVGFDKLIFKGRLLAGLQRMAAGNVSSGITLINGAFARLGATIATASSAFLAFLATPVGMILGAIALIGAALYLIVKYWDEIQAYARGVGDSTIALIGIFVPIVGWILLIAKYWNELKIIATNTWEGISSVANIAWILIREKVIKPLKSWFGGAWDFVKDKAKSFYAFLQSFRVLKAILQPVVDTFSAIWEFVTKIFDKIANGNFFKSIVGFVTSLSKAFKDGAKEVEDEVVKTYGNSEEKANLYKSQGGLKTASSTPGGGVKNERNIAMHGVTIMANNPQELFGELDKLRDINSRLA